MVWTPHYKRGPIIGLLVAIVALVALAINATSVSFVWVEVLLAVAGVGLGTIFPVTTVGVQNAVEPHQLGTATASFNFFRSLGSAILVAVFGAIFLGRLGLGGQSIGSLDALVAQAAAHGTAIGPAFQDVFAAAAAVTAVGFVCFLGMKELPLRSR
jgi:MFS family permease